MKNTLLKMTFRNHASFVKRFVHPQEAKRAYDEIAETSANQKGGGAMTLVDHEARFWFRCADLITMEIREVDEDDNITNRDERG